eukprot:2876123-Prymnesium_polylepis.1
MRRRHTMWRYPSEYSNQEPWACLGTWTLAALSKPPCSRASTNRKRCLRAEGGRRSNEVALALGVPKKAESKGRRGGVLCVRTEKVTRRRVHFGAQRQLQAERHVPLVESDVIVVHGTADRIPQASTAAREQLVVFRSVSTSHQ